MALAERDCDFDGIFVCGPPQEQTLTKLYPRMPPSLVLSLSHTSFGSSSLVQCCAYPFICVLASQVPCLIDPNTESYLFESAAIVRYLQHTYSAESATASTDAAAQASSSGSSGGSSTNISGGAAPSTASEASS